MKLITFDAYRALGIPGVRYIKPEAFDGHLAEIRRADWILFPPHWQVNTLHYVLGRRMFPNIAGYHLGHDKVVMTRALTAAFPHHVPDTLILPPDERSVDRVLEHFTLPVVAKVPRSSMGAGVALLESAGAVREWARQHDVLYLQEYLPTRRDLRVVWVGDRVIGAYWREGAAGAFHNNVARGGRLSFDHVPEAALRLVERVARTLGLDHAGFDLMELGGHFYVIEFNVLFGNEGLNRSGIPVGRHIHEHLLKHPGDPEPHGSPPLSLVG